MYQIKIDICNYYKEYATWQSYVRKRNAYLG